MAIIEEIINTLKLITIPRYFRTERGFQSEFYKQLSNNLDGKNIFPEHTILEAEVQKRNLDHYGVTQRPDLLIHIPIETGITQNANENNYVNFAFKLNGNINSSISDYEKLDQMFNLLNYELGIYININKYPIVYLNNYEGIYRNRIHEFSINLDNERVNVKHAFFENNELLIRDE